MFKLIAANAQGQLRPALLSKIKAAAANASQISSTLSHTVMSPVAATPQLYPYKFVRHNSTVSTKVQEQANIPPKVTPTTGAGATTTAEEFKKHPEQSEQSVLSEIDIQQKLDRFTQLNLAKKHPNAKVDPRFHEKELDESLQLLEIKSVRDGLTPEQLTGFIFNVERLIYLNKRKRLRKDFNKDRDDPSAFRLEIKVQRTALNLFDLILSGSLTHCLSADALYRLFLMLHQFYLRAEIVSYWEMGVSNSEISHFFVDQKVLSTALYVSYEMKRFSYEEVKQIFDINTPDKDNVYPDLLTAVGKVALLEKDYTHALDLFEKLMISLENKTPTAKGAISEMHLNFISLCREVEIAKHFFDRAYDDRKLPYGIRLKAPHMKSFMQNLSDAGESMDVIISIWRRLILKSQQTASYDPKGAKSANLNSGLFKIFFERYPDYSQEGNKYLQQIFEMNPQINEIFLNAAISNYSWDDRDSFYKLVNSFEKYNIKKSVISERIILKQLGSFEHSNEEILESWNNLLYTLDDYEYDYIAHPDWSSIRNATITSEKFGEERTGLFLSILKAYKDYMINDAACVKFIRGFQRDHEQAELINKFQYETPIVENEVEFKVIENFRHLKKRVNFSKSVKEYVESIEKENTEKENNAEDNKDNF
ncbi:Protein RMD9 mitochondrial [Spathaspora sp. JA1]|nr:Protein RMD9 mitochondrial [Spathaspora sp. JA1]